MKTQTASSRRLIVVHYHLRPGGVRRVLELALPAIAAARCGALSGVVLAVGEAGDAAWLAELRRSLGGIAVDVHIEPAFGYFSEQRAAPAVIRRRVAAALRALLREGSGDLVWAHNPGLARNLILADELARRAAASGARLISQHHDFWCENRWARWPEAGRCGFPTLDAVAKAIFAAGSTATHAAINGRDGAILSRALPGRSTLMSIPAAPRRPPSRGRVESARRWLRRALDDDGPVWVAPARFLRRKNLAEAVLLTRWLRPEGWLVSTAGISSADERRYAERLDAAARAGGWRVKFRVLEAGGPPVGDLVAASEAVVMTSVQEGFGLAFIEAASAGRALIARRLGNVAPDLERMGFSFPQLYDEILIAPELFDADAERGRQQALWKRWRARLPAGCRRLAREPLFPGMAPGEPAPFSRLTLTAQLEVLAWPAEDSWRACRAANPLLRRWRRGRLKVTRWPAAAQEWIGASAWAERFWAAVDSPPATPATARQAVAAQRGLLEECLRGKSIYPILLGDE